MVRRERGGSMREESRGGSGLALALPGWYRFKITIITRAPELKHGGVRAGLGARHN
jgi:hypothetical protein